MNAFNDAVHAQHCSSRVARIGTAWLDHQGASATAYIWRKPVSACPPDSHRDCIAVLAVWKKSLTMKVYESDCGRFSAILKSYSIEQGSTLQLIGQWYSEAAGRTNCLENLYNLIHFKIIMMIIMIINKMYHSSFFLFLLESGALSPPIVQPPLLEPTEWSSGPRPFRLVNL